MSEENIYGGGFFYGFDWDAVDDDCPYPGDCEDCPFREKCKIRKLLEEADGEGGSSNR